MFKIRTGDEVLLSEYYIYWFKINTHTHTNTHKHIYNYIYKIANGIKHNDKQRYKDNKGPTPRPPPAHEHLIITIIYRNIFNIISL